MSVHWEKELAEKLWTKCPDCKKDCPYKQWKQTAGCTEGKKGE